MVFCLGALSTLILLLCLVVTSYLSSFFFIATLNFIEFSPRWFSYPQHAKKITPKRFTFYWHESRHTKSTFVLSKLETSVIFVGQKKIHPQKNTTKRRLPTSTPPVPPLPPWMDFSGAPIAGGMVMARSHLVSTSFRKSSSESPSWVVDDAGRVPWWRVMTCGVLRCG